MSVKKTISVVLFGGLLLMIASSASAEDGLFSSSEGADDEQPGGNEGGDSSGGGLKLGGPLLLTQFTMQAGGVITVSPSVYIPKEGDGGGGGWFNFSPELGFFVIDKLEVLFSFGLGLPFGHIDTYDVTVGFGLGARYFIDFDAIALYVGGTLGSHFEIPDNVDLRVRKYFDINLMVGILVALNPHVGLDVGMRFNTAVLLGDYPGQPGAYSEISFPIGYFGVQGFFNIIKGG